MESILAALRKVPGNRISAETGVAVLRAGIGAVALRLPLLDELPPTAGQPSRATITAALDAIFDEIFADGVGADANWGLARNSALRTVVEIALNKLAEYGATKEDIEKMRETIQELLKQDALFDPDSFATQLDHLLRKAA